MQHNIQQVLEGHSLVPVITFNECDSPEKLMQYLIENGVRCIEITLRTPQGIKAIETLKKSFGSEILVGAGTVTTQDILSPLKDIGTDFIVSPGFTGSLIEGMEASGIPYLPGIATPSDVMQLKEMGLTHLKFFPANQFGGKSMLKTYGALFPSLKFCPTGGITEETSADYLALDNVFAVGGSWFQNDFNKSIQE